MSTFTKPIITDAIEWYNQVFKLTDLYRDMENVTEGSPWHRERSVAAHTDMVFANGISLASNNNVDKKVSLYILMSCAFHDVGKVAAKTTKFKESRGKYLSFNGHELISARLWEDYAVTNFDYLVARFGFTLDDIFHISWLIQNHLWHSVKPSSLVGTIREQNLLVPFISLLLADQMGRISDDYNNNVKQTVDYTNTVAHLVDTTEYVIGDDVYKPTMYLPIAVSGSGKSTFARGLDPSVEIYSWDQLRLDWYGEPYEKAFHSSTKDKKFSTKAQKVLFDILKSGNDVYIDNMNHTRKARKWLVSAARANGYRVEAIMFPVTMKMVINRQKSRSDKTLPEDLVRNMYLQLSVPNLVDEVDSIVIHPGNVE